MNYLSNREANLIKKSEDFSKEVTEEELYQAALYFLMESYNDLFAMPLARGWEPAIYNFVQLETIVKKSKEPEKLISKLKEQPFLNNVPNFFVDMWNGRYIKVDKEVRKFLFKNYNQQQINAFQTIEQYIEENIGPIKKANLIKKSEDFSKKTEENLRLNYKILHKLEYIKDDYEDFLKEYDSKMKEYIKLNLINHIDDFNRIIEVYDINNISKIFFEDLDIEKLNEIKSKIINLFGYETSQDDYDRIYIKNQNLKNEITAKKKPETAPSAKAPKKWWYDKIQEIKKGNPGYSKDQVTKTVGRIWSDLSDSKKKEIREREGKKYKKAFLSNREAMSPREILDDIEPIQSADYDKIKSYLNIYNIIEKMFNYGIVNKDRLINLFNKIDPLYKYLKNKYPKFPQGYAYLEARRYINDLEMH